MLSTYHTLALAPAQCVLHPHQAAWQAALGVQAAGAPERHLHLVPAVTAVSAVTRIPAGMDKWSEHRCEKK